MARGRKPGFHHSEETKAKMRGKKKPYSQDHKDNMSAAMTEKWKDPAYRETQKNAR